MDEPVMVGNIAPEDFEELGGLFAAWHEVAHGEAAALFGMVKRPGGDFLIKRVRLADLLHKGTKGNPLPSEAMSWVQRRLQELLAFYRGARERGDPWDPNLRRVGAALHKKVRHGTAIGRAMEGRLHYWRGMLTGILGMA